MNTSGKILLVLNILFIVTILSAEANTNDTIWANYAEYHIDDYLDMVVCNTDIEPYADLSNNTSLHIQLESNDLYQFKTIPSGLKTGISYIITGNNKTYALYFTDLPLIHINTEYYIGDEPKVPARFIISDGNNDIFSSFIGIERRGGISQGYPKKSYDLELWKDSLGLDTLRRSLLSMRNDDDWLLIAMYNEPMRLRNAISHELWLKIHTLYYHESEPDAVPGIHTEYVELFLNDEYNGIYLLTEQVDRKQLKLKKYIIETSTIRGLLNKGIYWGDAVTYDGAPGFSNSNRVWSGFEMKYPKEEEITDWTDLYNFVNLVVNGSESDFLSNIVNMFNIDNAVDYFLYLNILRGTDNRGKNIYVSRYDEDEPFVNIPWDLDGTWGMLWNGSRQDITDDIKTNGMYERLMNLDNDFFNLLLRSRWNSLRENEFHEQTLMEMFEEKYSILHINGVYKREELKWGASTLDLQNIFYLNTWLTERLAFLDDYFPPIINSINDGNANTENLYLLYPNPVDDYINIRKQNPHQVYFEIFNILGLRIKTGFLTDNETRLTLNDMSSGTYILKISDRKQNSIRTFRIIKK
ncbi:MAG: CotH kinase family protein [Bacteroidota bacterium]|nr:CotH kinase family protein [Bacteroidota bacterium]